MSPVHAPWRRSRFRSFAGAGFALLVAALSGGWAVSAARADLIWAQKTVELATDGKSNVVEARFAFTNTGEDPVDIEQVQTSCGCTTAALAQRHYAPGESGEIVARYTIGDQAGVQKKLIAVSVRGDAARTLLTLIVRIPEPVRVRPASLAWQQDDPGTAKTITIESGDPGEPPLTAVSVEAPDQPVTVALKEVRKGAYELSVTPNSTRHQFFASLSIHCRCGKIERILRAYAVVQPRGPSPISPLPAAPPATAGSPE